MAGTAFTHTVTVDAPIEKVWDRLQAASTWENVGPVERVWDPVHGDDGRLLGYHWSTTVGGRPYEGTAKTVASHPHESMLLALDGGEVMALLTTALEAAGDGRTTIEVIMEIEPKGMMGTLFFPVITAAVRNGLRDHLEEFGARVGRPVGD
jgi:uncharacterized protein YndB with AHSA1/START domain